MGQRIRRLFKPAPAPPPYRRFTPPPWFTEPESELGVAVPVREVLVSKPEVVVALIDCVAYTTGFKFSIAMRTRGDLNPTAMGFPGPYMHRPPEEPMDFYKAIQEGREPDIPAGPVLSPMGGGGGGKRWDFRYWVWPLPPQGPVTITCEWAELWSGEVSADVDGAAIRRAGESSEKLW
jgi:hypothetical protein